MAAFLIAGPAGHVVLDGGYPSTAPMIMASIAKLGFDIKDVKVLLNSEPHPDHAGGLTVLQQASGAKLWASEASADALASGGDDPDMLLPMRALFGIGLVGYPAARVDHLFKDGDTIRVGPFALTAHITGGHSRGCTSWSFPVRDGDRVLNVVSACDLGVPSHMLKALITTITTMKITTRTAIFAGVDLMDASLPGQATCRSPASLRECSALPEPSPRSFTSPLDATCADLRKLRWWNPAGVSGIAARCDKRSQPPRHSPPTPTRSSAGVLQHANRVAKARDAVLEAASEKAGRERVCEDQALALSEPLQANTGPTCFGWKNATDEFQSQGECLK